MAVKESSASKIKFKGVDALFGLSEEQECVREIPLDELDTFKNHPFKVFRDDKMEEMIESISEYGVLVPGIARPSNSGEKDYELVVGHRRKYACSELGLKTMPVIIRDMSDDEATVVMVDSNIQRENLLYSEKAFAYRMKYEALKRQGTKENVDVVCVVIKSTVVNGEGSTIVHSLLEKGINVIQEHPIDIDDYIMCIKIAQKNCCMYRLNTFYPQLSNVKQFIFLAGKLREKNDVQYINAECSVHVLFPLIDILGRAIGGVRPWKFERVEETYKNSPFCIIYGSIYNIPICINVQNQMDPSDPENSVLLFHKISLYTECGNLTMIGTNSDIMWEPRIRKYIAADGGFHLEADDEYLDLPVYEEMHNDEGKCFREMFSDTWPDSIKLFLEDFYRDFYLGKKMDSNAQFLISVCRAWKDLGNSIGSANIIHAYTTKPIKISEIVK